MAFALKTKLIIIWFGIQLSLEETVTNNCGRLIYDEPAVAGRNVTLTFKPDEVFSNESVIWRHTRNALTGWFKVSEQWNYHLDTFSLVINTSLDDQGRLFYVQYRSCTSGVITLKLKVMDTNSCGYWYERTSSVRPGGTVELGYFPTWAIINNKANYVRIFEVTNSRCPNGCQIQDLPGVYEIRALDYNHEYVLAITLRDTFVNGRYRLRCTTGRYEGNTYTEYIEVFFPERPNKPKLDTQRFEDCHNCIVGNLRDNLAVRCNVTGGTAPLNVTITVADENMNVFSGTDGIFTVNIQLTNKIHMAKVQCSVTNLALHSPLTSEARLYIIVNPLKPVFNVPEMRDDAPLTYPTCTSSGARPPSHVEFKSSNSELSNASRTTRTETANLYNTATTLIKMEKAWNLQNLTCCVRNFTDSQEWCQSKQLIYKFKPESVRVSLVKNYTEIQPYYAYNVTCSIRQAYPACSVSWSVPGDVDKLGSTELRKGTNVVTTEAAISLNISRKDNWKEVRCTAWCTGINYDQSDTHVIFVPYKATISFNVSSPISLTESTTTAIECTARWASTVRWLDSENNTALRVVDCGTGAACLQLEDVSKKHGGNYTCLASDKLYNVSKQLSVIVRDLPDEPTVTWYGLLGLSKMIAIVIITSGIVILLFAVILGVVCIRRRTSNMSEVLQNRGATAGTDNREVDARHEEIHEYEEIHEFEGLAESGPSHAYEGLAERGPSHEYEGLADRSPSHAYEGLAEKGPSHVYEY